MKSFLTLEDINSVITEYYNTPFWDKTTIDINTVNDFSNLKFNYLTVSRAYSASKYTFTIQANNDLLTGHYYILDSEDTWLTATSSDNVITVVSDTPTISVYCQLYAQSTTQSSFNLNTFIVKSITPNVASISDSISVTVELESVKSSFDPNSKTFTVNRTGSASTTATCTNNKITFDLPYSSGYSFSISYDGETTALYTINPVKEINIVDVSDLTLINGKSNSFDVVSQSSNLTVECDYPATISGTRISVDLTGKDDHRPITLIVKTVEDTTYYGNYFTFKIPCSYPTITTEQQITDLFTNGGVGRLGANITLTSDLTLSKDVAIIGNDYNINLANHTITVPEGKTIKASQTTFTNGLNTITQQVNSKVELTDCTFTGCTSVDGLGAVINCDIDLTSLDNPTDFTTTLTRCTISNSDSIILHGGDLTIDQCNITGKIANKNYPYALYQTDGNASITNTQFNISSNTQISSDIGFNSCIFCCGENAIINNGDHMEWQNNNIQGFLTNNTSTIDLTYYYEPIEDYITLQATKGYCHSVSDVDTIYKTNVTVRRD